MPLWEAGDYIDHIDVDDEGTVHYINGHGVEVARFDSEGRYRYNVDYADPFRIDTPNPIGENPIDAIHLHYTAGTGTGNAADWWRAAPATTATNYTYTINAGNITTVRPWMMPHYDFDTATPINNDGYVTGRIQGTSSITERIKNYFFGDKDSEQEKPIKVRLKLLFED